MNYDPNVISFMIMAVWKNVFVVWSYGPPNYKPKVHQVEQALTH